MLIGKATTIIMLMAWLYFWFEVFKSPFAKLSTIWGIKLTLIPIATAFIIIHILGAHVATILAIVSLSRAVYPSLYDVLTINVISVKL